MKGTAVRIFGSRSARIPTHPGTHPSFTICESWAHDAANIKHIKLPARIHKTSLRHLPPRSAANAGFVSESGGSLFSIFCDPTSNIKISKFQNFLTQSDFPDFNPKFRIQNSKLLDPVRSATFSHMSQQHNISPEQRLPFLHRMIDDLPAEELEVVELVLARLEMDRLWKEVREGFDEDWASGKYDRIDEVIQEVPYDNV